jgi:hypothetical protein
MEKKEKNLKKLVWVCGRLLSSPSKLTTLVIDWISTWTDGK